MGTSANSAWQANRIATESKKGGMAIELVFFGPVFYRARGTKNSKSAENVFLFRFFAQTSGEACGEGGKFRLRGRETICTFELAKSNRRSYDVQSAGSNMVYNFATVAQYLRWLHSTQNLNSAWMQAPSENRSYNIYWKCECWYFGSNFALLQVCLTFGDPQHQT